jgi:hypothetical protein
MLGSLDDSLQYTINSTHDTFKLMILSAYVLHILNNSHKYGPPENTLRMLKPCQKGNFTNLWETFHIQQLHHLCLLIDEQQQHKLNPLYTLGRVPQQSTASSSG